MRLVEIQSWPYWYNARWIDVVMRDVVMAFDVIHVDRFGDAGLLIKIQQVAVKVWVIQNSAHIAFEMAVINRVETH